VEKREQNPASPRSLPACDGHWKGLRGKLWHPRAGAFISQHIHFASVTDAGMEGVTKARVLFMLETEVV